MQLCSSVVSRAGGVTHQRGLPDSAPLGWLAPDGLLAEPEGEGLGGRGAWVETKIPKFTPRLALQGQQTCSFVDLQRAEVNPALGQQV